MKYTLIAALLVAGILTLGGCGGSTTQSTEITPQGSTSGSASASAATPTATPLSALALTSLTVNGPAQSTLSSEIPPDGGTLLMPVASAVTSEIVFGPGATAGTLVKFTNSVNDPTPTGAKRASSQSGSLSEPFYYVDMKVTKATPISLIRQIAITGAVPIGVKQYVAEFVDDATNQVLASLPGTFDGSTAVFAQSSSEVVLEPGRVYEVRFRGVPNGTVSWTFKNQSGKGPVYIFVRAFAPNFPTDKKFYHMNKGGLLVPDAMSDARITPVPPPGITDIRTGYADYSIPMVEGQSIQLPLMNAPRLYVSLGKTMPVQLTVINTTAEQPVNYSEPDITGDPTNPNYDSLLDFLELTVDGNVIGINMTEVTMMGVPMQVDVFGRKNGAAHTYQVGFKPGARDAVFSGLYADPSFKSLIVPAGTTDPTKATRFLNPSYGIGNKVRKTPNVAQLATFDPDFYQSYIDKVWAKYKNEKLTMYTSAFGTFEGQVDGSDSFVFKQTVPGIEKAPNTTYTFPKPKPYDTSSPGTIDPTTIGTYAALVGNVGPFTGTPTDAVAGEIGGALAVGVCRTSLLINPVITRHYPPFDDCKVDDYYVDSPVNLYAKLIHDWSLPSADKPDGASAWGGAYAFGLDDNCNQSSVLNVPVANVDSVTVNIPPFAKP